MDPWSSLDSSTEGSGQPSATELRFEDSFVYTTELTAPSVESIQPPLADSDQYLNKLYGRLSRLQRARSGPQLLRSLQLARQHQLSQLLSGNVGSCETSLEEEVAAGYLQRRLLPQTVPLSREELTRLLESDQLQLTREQAAEEERSATGTEAADLVDEVGAEAELQTSAGKAEDARPAR